MQKYREFWNILPMDEGFTHACFRRRSRVELTNTNKSAAMKAVSATTGIANTFRFVKKKRHYTIAVNNGPGY